MNRIFFPVLLALMAIPHADLVGLSNGVSHRVMVSVRSTAALELSDAHPLRLTVDASADSRDLFGGTDSIRRLWYSSVNTNGTQRKITVRMTGTTPPGTSLSIEAVGGETAAGSIVGGRAGIAPFDRVIVMRIPSCATGRRASGGTGLKYSLEIIDPGSLSAGTNTAVKVLYTLTDDG